MVVFVDREFREKVVAQFHAMKFEFVKRPHKLTIPTYWQGHVIGRLCPIHADFSSENVHLLAKWRSQNREAFFTWFLPTEQDTEKWLKEQILLRDDRILFFVETLEQVPFGHIGITNFDFLSRSCEIDNVLCGRAGLIKGGMSAALQALMDWVFSDLSVKRMYVRVFYDNQRALDFYTRNGFQIVKRVLTQRVEEGSVIRWVEAQEVSGVIFEKYVLYLAVEQDQWETAKSGLHKSCT